ncbi:MAG: cation:proton antiporter [bacterium]|nr:cation:proton antiporter [bacterium]
MFKKFLPYILMTGGLFLITVFSSHAESFFALANKTEEGNMIQTIFLISIMFLLSFLAFNFTRNTIIPSFVAAILVGVASHSFLKPIIEEKEILSLVVSLGATIILFNGGLETSFLNFRKLFAKIISLSFLGLLLTAFLFSLCLSILSSVLNLNLSLATIILLGAVLASTDPAAIIPILKQLRFNKKEVKDIIISESAVTDVTGTLLTVAFITAFTVAGNNFQTIGEVYKFLFSATTGIFLLKEVFFGIIFGVGGYYLLVFLTWLKKRQGQEFEADAIFFLFIPMVIFALAVIFGGSGYLAAFVAGLLFYSNDHLHHSEKYFNQTIEGILKPAIFLLLGALVNIQELISFAWIGILIALIFMFIIRPIAVFVSFGPFYFKKEGRFSIRELLFISFVRETGAIPAMLLTTIASLGIVGLDGFVAIGMWVILATLIIEPPLTPLIAKILKVAEPITELVPAKLVVSSGQMVVLGSRGHSFVERLSKVADWAIKHNIVKIVLLHCPEDKYTEKFVKETEVVAKEEFKNVNKKLEQNGHKTIQFSFLSCRGFLQDNISNLASQKNNISMVFVGKSILDYRLSDIKNLNLPFYFLE